MVSGKLNNDIMENTKKKFSFYIFLFATFPFLLLFQENINEIHLQDIFLPIFFSIGIIFIPWIILRKFIGSDKSALILSFLIIILMLFAYVRSSLWKINWATGEIEAHFLAQNIILIPIFIPIVILGIIFISRKKITSKVTTTMNVVGFVILLSIISQIGIFYLEHNASVDEVKSYFDIEIPIINENQKPNIYVIILDSYPGELRLNDFYNYDNSEYYQQLRERGFYLQTSTFSNYAHTEYSVPSMLNLNYLDSIIKEKKFQNLLLMKDLSTDSIVADIFRENGYKLFSYGVNDYTYLKDGKNLCKEKSILNDAILNTFYSTYVPINSIRNFLVMNDSNRADEILCTIDSLKNFNSKVDEPFFIYAHIMFPHRPYIFDSSGNVIDEITENDKIKFAFLDQVKFANKFSIEIIDSIQNKDPNSVIILTADHSDRIGLGDNEIKNYIASMNVMTALSFPGKNPPIQEKITNVNLFRILFNTYFDTEFEILENRIFWYDPHNPYERYEHENIIEKLKEFL